LHIVGQYLWFLAPIPIKYDYYPCNESRVQQSHFLSLVALLTLPSRFFLGDPERKLTASVAQSQESLIRGNTSGGNDDYGEKCHMYLGVASLITYLPMKSSSRLKNFSRSTYRNLAYLDTRKREFDRTW
jgi:hypothetical protein